MTDKTLDQMLADAGFSHGRYPRTDTTQKHVIWHTETGELQGYMTAFEAAEWLASQA